MAFNNIPKLYSLRSILSSEIGSIFMMASLLKIFSKIYIYLQIDKIIVYD